MHADVVANAARIGAAQRLTQEDQATIQALKREIEKAWKMMDEAHEREDRACESIAQLKAEIGSLTQVIERNATFAQGHEQE